MADAVLASYTSRTVSDEVLACCRNAEINSAAITELPPRSMKKSSSTDTPSSHFKTETIAAAITC